MRCANPALKSVRKTEQKRLLEAESIRRHTGDWGAWETMILDEPRDFGHVGTFAKVHRNRVFSVLDRTDFSGARHLAIASGSGIRPTWPEMQRINNDLAGASATAIEVYPPDDEVVDQADMYHLWVLPGRLPFSLTRR